MLSQRCLKYLGVSSLIVCSLLSVSAAAGPVDSWESMREKQRIENETMLGNLPLLNRTRVQDVMQLRVESRALTVRTPLATTRAAGFVRCKLSGMGQFALVRVQGGSEPYSAEAVVPASMQFNLTDYTQPRRISTLAVTTQSSSVNISRSLQFPNGYQHVQLMEQNGSNGPAQSGTVTLAVNESLPDEGPPVNVSFEAEDFFTLLRRYPKETEHYVRPILRDLGQEAVFAPDPLIAWQVFADLWKPDATASQQVDRLLPGLDSVDFRERQRALHSLQALGRDGASVMVHLDRTHLSAEQNARVDRALAPYTQLPETEAEALRSQTGFLLDCLYCDDVTLRRAAFRRLRELDGPQLQFDVESDPAGSSLEVARLRAIISTQVAR